MSALPGREEEKKRRPPMDTFFLRTRRLHISQEDVAKLLGVPQNTLSAPDLRTKIPAALHPVIHERVTGGEAA